ncbi:bifunctional diguanylate cyclase/phosphodiesterase [Endobacterium cereale]|uniref:bifunctional diguanylate cyclase/phosphodiesterase n=1 Tax=Endobacterium cereale TaxID=2663029 RepID=UPI001AD9509A|nr:EAL domain-containing protein [Endobacterium cereale]MEB2846482.1 EAL domain-containing protein [Endobacterium cereale]
MDQIVKLAARVFNVPTSLLSFLDEDTQWFAAQTGFDPCGTTRDLSFCAHALDSAEILVVADARADDRFRSNALVTSDPFIRFYAGAPLVTSKGHILGTLCIIDTLPREDFSAEDRETLQAMANLAMDQLELNRSAEMQKAALCLNQTSPDAIIHIDAGGMIMYANRAARTIFGYQEDELVNSPIDKLLPVKLQKKMAAVVRKFRASRSEFLSFTPIEAIGLHKSAGEIPIEFSAGIWASNKSFCMGVIVRDIEERKRREASFEMLFDRNPIPMWIFDAGSLDFLAINDAACALYGYTRPEALTKNALDMRPAEEREEIRATIKDFGDFYQSERPGTHVAADGGLLRVLTFARRLRHNNKDCVVVANVDVTERDMAQNQLASTEIFLNAVVESIPSMVFVKDAASGKFVLLNKAGERLLGTRREDLIGKSDFDLFDVKEAERFRKADEAVMALGELVTIENEPISTPAGMRSLRTQKIGVPDANGNPRYLLGISEDVTERLEVEQQNRHMSLHDILTDLPNRHSFQVGLDRQLASSEPFALIMIDLDRFKGINDTLGHQAGDELLRQIAREMVSVKGDQDIVARLGGDEFSVIHKLDGAGDASANKLADRLISVLAKPYIIDGHAVSIGCSLGIAISPGHGSTADVLIKRADLALYVAKSTGEGEARLFESSMETKADRERLLRGELQNALTNEQFHLDFQPIVDAETGKIVCCEALLRWNHPKLGSISPTEFIPAAEASGLIVSIGRWVLEQACNDASRWPSDVKVAVNLSPRQFSGFGLAASVAKALAVSGLTPDRLELEITESVFLSDTDDNIRVLNGLKSLGARIALDDFGTGYSSLAYLRKFSFDKLKIDRSFVTDVAVSDENLAIVRAIIGLGRSFSAIVTAEGVETNDQCDCLRVEGCDQLQGYLFSKPVASAELIPMLREAQSGQFTATCSAR